MSRTRKDAPYFVRARKNGKVEHDYSCLDYSPTKSFTKVTTEIFFANEVKKMEALEAELAENVGTFTVKEHRGYLVTRTGAVSAFRWATARRPREVVPVRLFVDSVYHHPNFYSKVERYGMEIHVEHTVSDFDVFYVYTVTRTVKSGRNWGPRGQQSSEECCTPTLPWHLNKCGRSCCGEWWPEDPRNTLTDDLKASAKIFNSGGITAFDEELQPEDEPVDLLPNIVYTSETPVSV